MRGVRLLIFLYAVVLAKLLLDAAEYLSLPDTDCVKPEDTEDIKKKSLLPANHSEGSPYARSIDRMKQLRHTCSKLGLGDVNEDTTEIRAHMSPNKTVLYCRINKCGSTLTLELLKQLFDCNTDCLLEHARMVKESTQAAPDIMGNAFSFFTVREPYTRIFSTYSNIFYFPKEDWFYRSSKIIKIVRSNPSYTSVVYGNDLTFAELVKYIVDNFEKGLPIDEHVRPMSHKSCNPCEFNYDYMVKLETMKSDTDYLLEEWQRRGYIQEYDPNIMTKLREWTLFGPVNHLFKVIASVKDTEISVYNLFLRAWSYYQITGQISKFVEFPYEEKDISKITKASFRTKLQEAMDLSKKTGQDVGAQRLEALREAYSTVPKHYMDKLRNVVKTDCMMFGYDPKPSFLENLTQSDTLYYFKGI